MKLFLATIIILFTVETGYAAKLHIEYEAPPNQPVTVSVYLDAEQDALSAVAGDFSFPASLFDEKSVSLDGSIVPLWIVEPKSSKEIYLDGRVHIPFEGIFPGGFGGVKSAYYEGERPGLLFSLKLIPQQKGEGIFLIDDVVLNSFSIDGAPLKSDSVSRIVNVSGVLKTVLTKKEERQIENTTLSAFITRDPLISRNAWYVMVHQQISPSPIESILVQESSRSMYEPLDDKDWRKVTLPYILYYQDRTKYVHMKILYTDGTYVLRTLSPVENSQNSSPYLGILVLVLGALFMLLPYVKTALFSSKKKS